MVRTPWRELDPQTRRLIFVGGTVEGVWKVATLIDLARRPAAVVHGPKRWWAAAIVLVNSVGLMPLAYFIWGRKRRV